MKYLKVSFARKGEIDVSFCIVTKTLCELKDICFLKSFIFCKILHNLPQERMKTNLPSSGLFRFDDSNKFIYFNLEHVFAIELHEGKNFHQNFGYSFSQLKNLLHFSHPPVPRGRIIFGQT